MNPGNYVFSVHTLRKSFVHCNIM